MHLKLPNTVSSVIEMLEITADQESLTKLTISLALFPFTGPSPVPRQVGRWIQHVTVPYGNGNKKNSSRVVTDLLDAVVPFLLYVSVTDLALLWWLSQKPSC